MEETTIDKTGEGGAPGKNTVIPPACLKGLSPDTQQMLLDPITHKHPLVNDAKIRRLFLQATSQQWFASNKINFDAPIEHDPRSREIWIKLNLIFFTMEKMGLNVIENMISRAVRKLRSDEAAYYLSVQGSDEARHVFVAENYLKKLGHPPKYDYKFHILGQVASMGFYRVENWLFSTLFSENFASAYLRRSQKSNMDSVGLEMCKNLILDEARHLHFLHVVLPDIMDRLSLFGRAYVKASQYFIMKFTEVASRTLEEDAAYVGLDRVALMEEVFENIERAYESFGVSREFLWFPRIAPARYKGTIIHPAPLLPN